MARTVPSNVRTGGYLCLALGILATLSGAMALAVAILIPDLRHPFPQSSLPVRFLGAHFTQLAGAQVPLAVLFSAGSVAFARGREWGRRVLVIMFWLALLYCLAFLVLWELELPTFHAPSYSEMVAQGTPPREARVFAAVPIAMAVGGLIVVAFYGVPVYLVIRWLRSPTVVEACRGDGQQSLNAT